MTLKNEELKNLVSSELLPLTDKRHCAWISSSFDEFFERANDLHTRDFSTNQAEGVLDFGLRMAIGCVKSLGNPDTSANARQSNNRLVDWIKGLSQTANQPLFPPESTVDIKGSSSIGLMQVADGVTSFAHEARSAKRNFSYYGLREEQGSLYP